MKSSKSSVKILTKKQKRRRSIKKQYGGGERAADGTEIAWLQAHGMGSGNLIVRFNVHGKTYFLRVNWNPETTSSGAAASDVMLKDGPSGNDITAFNRIVHSDESGSYENYNFRVSKMGGAVRRRRQVFTRRSKR